MGRYIGPNCRLCRRIGDKLMVKGARCFSPKCSLEKRGNPPGPHIVRRRRISDRGMQLKEKQRARYTYGMLESQFHRLFLRAARQPGITGENLMVLLERRLDNIVYRLGFAESRPQARQLVQHGHIIVNGHTAKSPSHIVNEGDEIRWTPGGSHTEYYKALVASIESRAIPNWLRLDKTNLVGQVSSLPTPEDIDTNIQGKTIVEYYSR